MRLCGVSARGRTISRDARSEECLKVEIKRSRGVLDLRGAREAHEDRVRGERRGSSSRFGSNRGWSLDIVRHERVADHRCFDSELRGVTRGSPLVSCSLLFNPNSCTLPTLGSL